MVDTGCSVAAAEGVVLSFARLLLLLCAGRPSCAACSDRKQGAITGKGTQVGMICRHGEAPAHGHSQEEGMLVLGTADVLIPHPPVWAEAGQAPAMHCEADALRCGCLLGGEGSWAGEVCNG